MQWTESGWVVELEANPQETIVYKHVIVTHSGDAVWEGGPNCVLNVPNEGEFEVITHWDCTHEELQLQGEPVVNELVGVREESKQEQAQAPEVTSSQLEEVFLEVSTFFVHRWQGSAGNDRKEGTGMWDTTGLDGVALQTVEGDKNAKNWWEKLEVVRALVTGEPGKKEWLKSLTHVAVYLKWISTREINSDEVGQHYRPNQHAEIPRRIFVEFEQVTVDSSSSLRELLLVQKIHSCCLVSRQNIHPLFF
ncbi:phosphoglucan, water dikinase, chloroplastic-like [Physcomitrium patens]|uniref:phosphoglucan, water dikinase, chloroplastic-like n=1 Tax=Physcomitrium patens TaxID=3218 RepID=UPI000D1769CC|nr:phosphoglucan, water dikinase, chloroplastic-like [Physcomitrium patens]|eukprot:XP_024401414.1 phosphoglucan, water dikinase, chloroplastic-like [Physcomitrella patens]